MQPYGLGCDIWSLGCLSHVLLVGQYPFKDSDPEIQGAQICLQELDLENDALYMRLSLQCKDMLQIMLAKEERERATIDQILNHAWFK